MFVDLKPFMGQTSLQDISDIIECPVCIGLSSSGSFLQCRNGHIGCQACFSRLPTCPVCRLSFCNKPKIISDEILIKMLSELRHIEKSEIFVQNVKLSQYFQCEGCNFVPTRKPIYLQCPSGHLFCNDCSKPGYCEACKKTQDYPRSRSIFSEKILSRMKKPCRFANKGCTKLIEDFSEHETKEGTKRFSAIVQVDEVFLRAEIGCLNLPRVLADPSSMTSGNMFDITTTQCYMKLNSEDYFVMESHIDCGNCRFFMRYTGTPKNFMFKLRLFRPGFDKEIHVTGPVAPLDLPHYKIPGSHVFWLSSSEMRNNWYTEQQSISVSWDVSVQKVDHDVEQMTFKKNYISKYRPMLLSYPEGFEYVDGY